MTVMVSPMKPSATLWHHCFWCFDYGCRCKTWGASDYFGILLLPTSARATRQYCNKHGDLATLPSRSESAKPDPPNVRRQAAYCREHVLIIRLRLRHRVLPLRSSDLRPIGRGFLKTLFSQTKLMSRSLPACPQASATEAQKPFAMLKA